MENNRQIILAIDPGDVKSAYSLLDSNYHILDKGLLDNNELLKLMNKIDFDILAIEMIASYGMEVGKTVFDTCVWIGRFIQVTESRNIKWTQIYRIEEKQFICHDSRAKDANIRQALIDRFGIVGTKKNPGWFYGFKKDIWASYAVGVVYLDKKREELLKQNVS